ncbi:MAG: hypothetical protein ABI610_00915 [Acidobacteriota bacterium]
MAVFTGGSAFTMVRDVADGFVIPSEMTFKQFARQDFAAFTQEAEKLLREIRANQPPLTDVEGTQKRHRKVQRVQQAMVLARSVMSRRG